MAIKIDIKSLWRWFFCTTEWEILIFRLLNDLNCTLNGYFTPLLREKFFFRNFGSSSIWRKNVPPSAAKILQTGEKTSTAEITQFDPLIINFPLEFYLGLFAQNGRVMDQNVRVLKIFRTFVMLFLYTLTSDIPKKLYF